MSNFLPTRNPKDEFVRGYIRKHIRRTQTSSEQRSNNISRQHLRLRPRPPAAPPPPPAVETLQPPPNIESSSSTSKPLKIVLDDLPWDPSERKPISSYHPSQKDEIRRTYLLRGPCQPKGKKTDFPQTLIGNSDKLRWFNPKWYTEKHENWLEYSVKADRVYCLYCYLFKESGQKDAFAIEGVQCWHRKEERFEIHVGKSNSFHNRAVQKGEDLLKEAQSIPAVQKEPEQNKEYRIRLSTSVILAKGLLNGGLPFRGHDESEASLYRGHFIEFLKLFAQINEEIAKYILSNAPKNCQMTAPSIQKDICNCFAEEVLKMIFEELGDDVFSLLVDESRDISKKEQMAMVLRFVDKLGFVKERYIGVVHVWKQPFYLLNLQLMNYLLTAIDELMV
ncbi:zinc finger MYM-type protein 1-like [Helianthus annuus]|uniref:zinc finger MYM-type protein 1-like n=1 Tax=Helianthus annuus TaxID=4232 RepID=UPI000B9028E0|nr:zinc finger MYM-type protein 1-like [Helianthus annuus]